MEYSNDNQSEQSQNNPKVNFPMNSRIAAWLKNGAALVILIAIVIGSFWVSFQLGKRLVFPNRNLSEQRIQVKIPEPPPSIKDLQQAELFPVPKPAVKLPLEPAKTGGLPLGKPLKTIKASAVKAKKDGYYKIQAALFVDRAKAESLSRLIKEAGFDVFVKKVEGGWRVQAGAFKNMADAIKIQNALADNGFGSKILLEK